jgi:hypothetical protein
VSNVESLALLSIQFRRPFFLLPGRIFGSVVGAAVALQASDIDAVSATETRYLPGPTEDGTVRSVLGRSRHEYFSWNLGLANSI